MQNKKGPKKKLKIFHLVFKPLIMGLILSFALSLKAFLFLAIFLKKIILLLNKKKPLTFNLNGKEICHLVN